MGNVVTAENSSDSYGQDLWEFGTPTVVVGGGDGEVIEGGIEEDREDRAPTVVVDEGGGQGEATVREIENQHGEDATRTVVVGGGDREVIEGGIEEDREDRARTVVVDEGGGHLGGATVREIENQHGEDATRTVVIGGGDREVIEGGIEGDREDRARTVVVDEGGGHLGGATVREIENQQGRHGTRTVVIGGGDREVLEGGIEGDREDRAPTVVVDEGGGHLGGATVREIENQQGRHGTRTVVIGGGDGEVLEGETEGDREDRAPTVVVDEGGGQGEGASDMQIEGDREDGARSAAPEPDQHMSHTHFTRGKKREREEDVKLQSQTVIGEDSQYSSDDEDSDEEDSDEEDDSGDEDYNPEQEAKPKAARVDVVDVAGGDGGKKKRKNRKKSNANRNKTKNAKRKKKKKNKKNKGVGKVRQAMVAAKEKIAKSSSGDTWAGTSSHAASLASEEEINRADMSSGMIDMLQQVEDGEVDMEELKYKMKDTQVTQESTNVPQSLKDRLTEYGFLAKDVANQSDIEHKIWFRDHYVDEKWFYRSAFINNDAKDPSVELMFGNLNELTNYIQHNRLASDEVLAFKSHEPFQLSMDESCECSKYFRKVLKKELRVALNSLFEFKPGKIVKGIKNKGAFDARVDKCFKEIVDNKMNFVFVDQVDWEEPRYKLIDMLKLKKCKTVDEAKALGELKSLKEILSDKYKKKTLFLPPDDAETGFKSLDFIKSDHEHEHWSAGGKAFGDGFTWVCQVPKDSCVLDPNTIALTRPKLWSPGNSIPLFTTTLDASNRDDCSEVVETVKRTHHRHFSRSIVNAIDNLYIQLGSRDSKYGGRGGNAAGFFRAKSQLAPKLQLEADDIQEEFCLLLQRFLKEVLKGLGSNDFKFLFQQTRAEDKRTKSQKEVGATELDRALNFFSSMTSLEHYSSQHIDKGDAKQEAHKPAASSICGWNCRLGEGVRLVAGGFFSSAFVTYLPFTTSLSGAFFFRGSQGHGTVLEIIMIDLRNFPRAAREIFENCYRMEGNKNVVYISAVRRYEYKLPTQPEGFLESDSLYGIQTWGLHEEARKARRALAAAVRDSNDTIISFAGQKRYPRNYADITGQLTLEDKTVIMTRNAAYFARTGIDEPIYDHVLYP
ncbi:hypothetical protein TrCOL_g5272 [Triparma columacea]|uniref:Uncharacterized protein n=1 Tax=Triparma columacea TaxID=722753 RepID=A0A9W7GFV2_9STRA|nr:hypothetical protein TrCOL_g5272 [Triparma columacea]